MARLTARLEQAALLSLLAFATNLQSSLEEVTPQTGRRRSADRISRENQKTRRKTIKGNIKGSVKEKKEVHEVQIRKKEGKSILFFGFGEQFGGECQ